MTADSTNKILAWICTNRSSIPSLIEEVKGPGGGKKVSIVDPNGNLVNFTHGQESKTPAAETEITRETEDTGVT